VRTSAASPTPTTTPNPTIWTTAQGGAYYLKIVASVNAAITAFNKIPGDSAHFRRLQRAARTQIVLERKFLAQLLAAPWPLDVRPLARQLVATDATPILCYMDESSAKTWTDFVIAANSKVCNSFTAGAAVAETLRIHLGIGNVPTT
jgi:hypothetical protein